MEEEERCEEAFDGNHEGNEALPELKFRETQKLKLTKFLTRAEKKFSASETFHLAEDFSPRAAIFKISQKAPKIFILTGCGSCTHIDELYSK